MAVSMNSCTRDFPSGELFRTGIVIYHISYGITVGYVQNNIYAAEKERGFTWLRAKSPRFDYGVHILLNVGGGRVGLSGRHSWACCQRVFYKCSS